MFNCGTVSFMSLCDRTSEQTAKCKVVYPVQHLPGRSKSTLLWIHHPERHWRSLRFLWSIQRQKCRHQILPGWRSGNLLVAGKPSAYIKQIWLHCSQTRRANLYKYTNTVILDDRIMAENTVDRYHKNLILLAKIFLLSWENILFLEKAVHHRLETTLVNEDQVDSTFERGSVAGCQPQCLGQVPHWVDQEIWLTYYWSCFKEMPTAQWILRSHTAHAIFDVVINALVTLVCT